MKTKSKNKQGISLIVLVITIIVMIILAAAVILSLSSNGIINRANEAVSVTDEKQMQVLASTIWADAYLDYSEGKITEQQLIQRVKDELEEADKNYTQKYDVDISLKGVSVGLKNNDWITIYEDEGYTETGILNLGNKKLFNSTDTYRIEIEGEKYTGTLQGKLFNAGSGLYVFAVIENNEITYVTSMQQLQQILLTASAETVAVVVNQVTDESGNTTCNLVYMNASQQPVATEYKVTKIEKLTSNRDVIFEGELNAPVVLENIDLSYNYMLEWNNQEYVAILDDCMYKFFNDSGSIIAVIDYSWSDTSVRLDPINGAIQDVVLYRLEKNPNLVFEECYLAGYINGHWTLVMWPAKVKDVPQMVAGKTITAVSITERVVNYDRELEVIFEPAMDGCVWGDVNVAADVNPEKIFAALEGKRIYTLYIDLRELSDVDIPEYIFELPVEYVFQIYVSEAVKAKYEEYDIVITL